MNLSTYPDPGLPARAAVVGRSVVPPSEPILELEREQFTVAVSRGEGVWFATARGERCVSMHNALRATERLAAKLLGHDQFALFSTSHGREYLVIELSTPDPDLGGDAA